MFLALHRRWIRADLVVHRIKTFANTETAVSARNILPTSAHVGSQTLCQERSAETLKRFHVGGIFATVPRPVSTCDGIILTLSRSSNLQRFRLSGGQVRGTRYTPESKYLASMGVWPSSRSGQIGLQACRIAGSTHLENRRTLRTAIVQELVATC